MNDLQLLEQNVQRYVFRLDGDALMDVATSTTLAAHARLNIYADAYRLRLLEALGKDYPGLGKLLGAERFARLAGEYIESSPSRHFNIRWYGAGLAAFMTRIAEPLLAEMAAFEWAMGLAFDAPDEAVVSLDAMAEIAPKSWSDMVLVPCQSLQRLQLHWNVAQLRKAVDDAIDLPPATSAAQASTWLVWRTQFKVMYRRLEPIEAFALEAVLAGQNFGTLCEALCEWCAADAAAATAARNLKRWIGDGLISSIRLRE